MIALDLDWSRLPEPDLDQSGEREIVRIDWRRILIAAAIARHERRRVAIERLFIAAAILEHAHVHALRKQPSHYPVASAWEPGFLDAAARDVLSAAAAVMGYVFDVGSPGEIAAEAKVQATRLERAGNLAARRTWQRVENDARREEPMAETLLASLSEERHALAMALYQQLVTYRRDGRLDRVVEVADALVAFVRTAERLGWAHARRRLEPFEFTTTSGGGDVCVRQRKRRRANLREYMRHVHPDLGGRAHNMSEIDVSEYRNRYSRLPDLWTSDDAA